MSRFTPAFRPILALLLAAAAIACAEKPGPLPVADPASLRTPPAGPVEGFVGAYGSHVWLGIPYAQAPVGALRWRAPQPTPPSSETRQALAFGSRCPQIATRFGGAGDAEPGTLIGDEDCLFLNIYAPRRDSGQVPEGRARWPVMFWIHGGGNVMGSADFYDGGNLAQTRDVVVVSVNYRLGPLGWFRNAALRGAAADDAEGSGNFALLDLIRALEWVRDDIAAFGGDPNNVTIFGESAGGTDVFALLLSPLAKGLFHRAIVESGGTRFVTTAEAENPVDAEEPGAGNSSSEVILRWLVDGGSAPDRAAARAWVAGQSDAAIRQMLRERTLPEIFAAYGDGSIPGFIDVPRLFRDGVVLPAEEPEERLARAGGYNQVPVMLGSNKDEMKLFMFANPAWVRRTLGIFFRIRDPERYDRYASYVSRMWKATGVDEPAAAMRAVQGPSVYAYRFDWDEEPTVLGADLSEMLGAAHAFEIPFVFGHFDLGRGGRILYDEDNAPARSLLSQQMMSYWTEFAYTGAPGRGRDGELVEWTAWDDATPSSGRFMRLDTPAGGGLRMSPDRVGVSALLAQLANDPGVAGHAERCGLYRGVADWGRAFTRDDYAREGGGGCGDLPFDEWPWGD